MTLIYPIVEGHGEVSAFPILVRRILHERLATFDCNVATPFRIPRSKIGQLGNDLAKGIRLGEAKIRSGGGEGGVLVLADADDDCPATLHASFLEFVHAEGFGVPVSLVMANREYEAWMIACGEQMRTHAAIRDDAPSHPDPESIRGAKGFFEREIMLLEMTYSETVDQAKFSSLIAIDVVHQKCRSFRKLTSEVRKLSSA